MSYFNPATLQRVGSFVILIHYEIYGHILSNILQTVSVDYGRSAVTSSIGIDCADTNEFTVSIYISMTVL